MITLRFRTLFLAILATVFTVTTLSGCVVSESPISGNRRAYAYSWEEEIRLGREADGQIIAQYGLYDDAALAEYVNSLGQALLEVSHLRRPGANPEFAATQFHFRVLDSPVVNAFALPGGYVYVTRGLLAHTENEAQLAVVIGHEIGHVAGRHGSKRALNQLLGQSALLAGAIGGQMIFGGETANSVLQVGGTAAQFLFLSYGRDDERESDDLGVEYASMAGYDASEGSGFFQTLRRLGEQTDQEIPTFMSTHPDPGEREETIRRDAATWATRVSPTDRVGRDDLMRQVDGIVYGENPRHGFVRAGMFHHPELEFSFPIPSGFQVANQPAQVGMISENGQAVVVMRIDQEATSAREAADALRSNQNISIVESGQGVANGLSAWYVVADASTTDGQNIRVRAQFIDYGGNVYVFQGMSLRDSFANWRSTFDTTMRGFQPLTDPGLLATQPIRLQTRTAPNSATLASLFPADLPVGITAEELAILNQRQLGDTIPEGMSFKLVQ